MAAETICMVLLYRLVLFWFCGLVVFYSGAWSGLVWCTLLQSLEGDEPRRCTIAFFVQITVGEYKVQ